MICQSCDKSVGSLTQVKTHDGEIIGVCEECEMYYEIVG